jgi:hypothetical protein
VPSVWRLDGQVVFWDNFDVAFRVICAGTSRAHGLTSRQPQKPAIWAWSASAHFPNQ